MNRSRRQLALAAAASLWPAASRAQAFPARPVHFVVPYAPGGTADALAHTLGKRLSERWGKPMVVEHKPGAATTIAAEAVARAPADGHTLLLAPAPFVITQYAYPRLSYDSRRDFAPVTLLVSNPLVLVVNPDRVPARSLAEFLAAAKKAPGQLTYGTSGNGGLAHLAVELFRLQAGIDVVHVPYKGGAPAVTDLVGGQIAFMFASPLEVMPFVKSGKLRPLAVTSAQRVPYWPELPTFREAGQGDYEAYAWFGVVAPAATPTEVLTRLNADFVAALRVPEVAAQFAGLGLDIAAHDRDEFTRFLAAEHQRWSKAVRAANVRIE